MKMSASDMMAIISEICGCYREDGCAFCPLEDTGCKVRFDRAFDCDAAAVICAEWRAMFRKKVLVPKWKNVCKIIKVGNVKKVVGVTNIGESFVQAREDVERILHSYASKHDGEYYAVIEPTCYLVEVE